MAPLLSVHDYVRGVLDGDRTVLARAITLIESQHPEHRRRAHEVVQALLPSTGGAHRIGITGVPGVGKSTFIDQLGVDLTAGAPGGRACGRPVELTDRRLDPR